MLILAAADLIWRSLDQLYWLHSIEDQCLNGSCESGCSTVKKKCTHFGEVLMVEKLLD